MSNTYRIHGARYLRKYVADERSSIYAYMADVRRIADTLCKVPWERAGRDVPATMTLHTEEGLDWNAEERERFDAAEWCAEHSDGMHRAYAQAACYVFELPNSAVGTAIEKIGVSVTSDPYNPYGARISALTSDTLDIPTDCATVRTGDIHREPDESGMGAAPRLYVENEDGTQTWYANTETVELTPATTLLAKKYLFVFVCLENYNRGRNGWIEGCSYIENDVSLTLASASADLVDDELNDLSVERALVAIEEGETSPTWLEPPTMAVIPDEAQEVPADAPAAASSLVETFHGDLPYDWSMNRAIGAGASSSSAAALTSATAYLDFTGSVTCTSDANCVSTFRGRWAVQINPSNKSITSVKLLYVFPLSDMQGDGYTSNSTVTASSGAYKVSISNKLSPKTPGTPTYNSTYSFSLVLAGLTVQDSPRGAEFVRVSGSLAATGGSSSNNSGYNTYYHTISITPSDAAVDVGKYAEYTVPADANDADIAPDIPARLTTVAIDGVVRRVFVEAVRDGGAAGGSTLCAFESNGTGGTYVGGVRTIEFTVGEYVAAGLYGLGKIQIVRRDSEPSVVEVRAVYDNDDSSATIPVTYRWTSEYTAPSSQPSSETAEFFDPSASLGLDANVQTYGLDAACGDFSLAVATSEPASSVSSAEVLGRLVRRFGLDAGPMMYMHPATMAMASELDTVRPVPRFGYDDDAEGLSSIGQPGLSAWFRRASGTVGFGYVQNHSDGSVSAAGVVSDPPFLQVAFLALRSPGDIAESIILKNAGNGAVHNDFAMRFVVWRSSSQLWNCASPRRMAALACVPNICRSEGEASLPWSVGGRGEASFPFGGETIDLVRIGVSDIVDGNIAAGAEIQINLSESVGAGDVIFIAPEVIGVGSGVSTSGSTVSLYFGFGSTPPSDTSEYVWARTSQNIGWFPQVKGR